VLIEHHVELLRCMDWLIDLGPESGDAGGRIVAAGPPEHVAAVPESRTGPFLRGEVPTEAPERTVRPSRRRILLDADAPNPPA
jgi:excinuclease ABC subunit A